MIAGQWEIGLHQRLMILLGVFTLFLVIVFFGLVSGFRELLKRAFQTAENMIEAQTVNYDTSAVELEHLDQSASNLLKTGYYYWNLGQRDKAKHYFALLIINHPWTEEATAALVELRST